MSYDFFSVQKPLLGKFTLTSRYVVFSLKTVPSSTWKDPMAEAGLQSDVLHQLKLRLATLSGGNSEEGAESSFSKTLRNTMNKTRRRFRRLHLRLCFFLTKVARIHIRLKKNP